LRNKRQQLVKTQLTRRSKMDFDSHRITAGYNTLIDQAVSTTKLNMNYACEEIDKTFGTGFANKHPELVIAFMQEVSKDFRNAIILKFEQEKFDHEIEAIGQLND